MKRILVLISFALCFSSCSFYRIDSETAGAQYYPPKASADQVTYVFEVTEPHEVIGTVTVNTERMQPLSEVIEKMKSEAALLGADAITNIRTNGGTGRWAKIKPQKLFGNANIRSNFIADAIVFQ